MFYGRFGGRIIQATRIIYGCISRTFGRNWSPGRRARVSSRPRPVLDIGSWKRSDGRKLNATRREERRGVADENAGHLQEKTGINRHEFSRGHRQDRAFGVFELPARLENSIPTVRGHS